MEVADDKHLGLGEISRAKFRACGGLGAPSFDDLECASRWDRRIPCPLDEVSTLPVFARLQRACDLAGEAQPILDIMVGVGVLIP